MPAVTLDNVIFDFAALGVLLISFMRGAFGGGFAILGIPLLSLGMDPIVVTGSANFSAASSNENDENMLVIRGDCRVADIYLGEYMRLWNHYAFRQWLASPEAKDKRPKYLRPNDQWTAEYFEDTGRARQRALFVSSPAASLTRQPT